MQTFDKDDILMLMDGNLHINNLKYSVKFLPQGGFAYETSNFSSRMIRVKFVSRVGYI